MKKQFSEEEVVNIVSFVAQLANGIKPSTEEMEAIPREIHVHIISALLAARTARTIGNFLD